MPLYRGRYCTVLENVWNFAVTCATYYFLVTDCAPGTRDETKQGYLPRPVRDPEKRRALPGVRNEAYTAWARYFRVLDVSKENNRSLEELLL